MPTPQHRDDALTQTRNLWLQVCRSRGTPAPEQTQVARFLASLAQPEHAELEHALLLCLNGREKRRELALVSWAASCTRPDFLARVQTHGLSCTGHALFSVGLGLMASGWDMSARIAQLSSHPHDVAMLATLLGTPVPVPAPAPPAAPSAAGVATLGPLAAPALQPVPLASLDSASTTAHVTAVPAPPEPAAPQAGEPTAPTPPKPGRTKRQGLAPVPHILAEEVAPDAFLQSPEDPELAPFAPPGRLQVRLFGRESAHTLEIGPHRRGASFMGVHVVTIESARALPDASGYDWGHKLMLQLTPEEMPLAAAVLMNLTPSARFTQHGAERDKFVELRRQEGGVVLVTGQGNAIHAVPVKTGALYYLLSLFCRAMARGLPGSSVAEVLALIKAAHP